MDALMLEQRCRLVAAAAGARPILEVAPAGAEPTAELAALVRVTATAAGDQRPIAAKLAATGDDTLIASVTGDLTPAVVGELASALHGRMLVLALGAGTSYREALALAARFDGRLLPQLAMRGALLLDSDPPDTVGLDPAGEYEPEYAACFVLLAGVDAPARLSLRGLAGPEPVRSLRALERSVEELELANVRLGRERLGTFDTAAAAALARIDRARDDAQAARAEAAEARHNEERWHAEADRIEAARQELARQLAELERRYDGVLGRRIVRLMLAGSRRLPRSWTRRS